MKLRKDTKGVIRSRKSKKDIQQNGQNKNLFQIINMYSIGGQTLASELL
jgi:hypothetical protein